MRLCTFSDEISLDFERVISLCAAGDIRAVEIRKAWDQANPVTLTDDELDACGGFCGATEVAPTSRTKEGSL